MISWHVNIDTAVWKFLISKSERQRSEKWAREHTEIIRKAIHDVKKRNIPDGSKVCGSVTTFME